MKDSRDASRRSSQIAHIAPGTSQCHCKGERDYCGYCASQRMLDRRLTFVMAAAAGLYEVKSSAKLRNEPTAVLKKLHWFAVLKRATAQLPARFLGLIICQQPL
jgi:hypothetical protein